MPTLKQSLLLSAAAFSSVATAQQLSASADVATAPQTVTADATATTQSVNGAVYTAINTLRAANGLSPIQQSSAGLANYAQGESQNSPETIMSKHQNSYMADVWNKIQASTSVQGAAYNEAWAQVYGDTPEEVAYNALAMLYKVDENGGWNGAHIKTLLDSSIMDGAVGVTQLSDGSWNVVFATAESGTTTAAIDSSAFVNTFASADSLFNGASASTDNGATDSSADVNEGQTEVVSSDEDNSTDDTTAVPEAPTDEATVPTESAAEPEATVTEGDNVEQTPTDTTAEPEQINQGEQEPETSVQEAAPQQKTLPATGEAKDALLSVAGAATLFGAWGISRRREH